MAAPTAPSQHVLLPLLPIPLLLIPMLLIPASAVRVPIRRLNSDSATEPPAATAVRSVYSGVEFVQGVLDPNVGRLLLMVDLTLRDEDWAGVSVPWLLERNLTLQGDPSVLPNPRIFNLNWVAGKIRMGNGVVFRIQSLVVQNYRLGNHNQAPGLDILAPCSRNATAVLEVTDVLGVHRVCYPPKVQQLSLAQIPRPAAIPGAQAYHSSLAQTGCVNDTSAPPLERCWPHRGMYDDVAMPGANHEANRVQLTGYIVHMIRTMYLCDLLMTDECVSNLTALGCATLTYASLNPPWRPLAAVQQQQQRVQQMQGQQREESGASVGGNPWGAAAAAAAAAATAVAGRVKGDGSLSSSSSSSNNRYSLILGWLRLISN